MRLFPQQIHNLIIIFRIRVYYGKYMNKITGFLIIIALFIGVVYLFTDESFYQTEGQVAYSHGALKDLTKTENEDKLLTADDNIQKDPEENIKNEAQKLAKSSPVYCQLKDKTITGESISKYPYLGRQLIQSVGGVQGKCYTAKTTVAVFAESANKVCPIYKGSNGQGATEKCPTASVNKQTDGSTKIICWNQGSGCKSKTLAEPKTSEEAKKSSNLEKDLQNELRENKLNENQENNQFDAAFGDNKEFKLNAVRDGLVLPDGKEIKFESLGWTATESDLEGPGWITPDGQFISNKQLEAIHGSDLKLISEGSTGIVKNVDSGVVGKGNFELSNKNGNLGTQKTQTPVANLNHKNLITNKNSLAKGLGRNPGSIVSGKSSNINAKNGIQGIKTGSPYRSFEQPKALAQKPRSFIQRFVGGNGGVKDTLSNFVTGNNGAGQLRNTPQGDPRGGVQPRVVYVTPEFATPASINREFRSIQDIANDIALQTPSRSLTRVDHFAHTLNAVGGPSKSGVDTENKSFGRIQDLIVEDEAIRALRVAEEEGKRAKNAVFCRVNEEAERCEQRREEKAQEVERRVFTQQLEERVLPQGAIQHFLAVYDGWVRPSPAPKTRATSTLGALHAQDLNPTADYERVTDGTNFVLWVIDSVADATTNAVSKLTSILLGGDDEEIEGTDPVQ